MRNLISVRLETTLVLVQDRCTVCAKVPWAHKLFWMHPMVLLVTWLKWKLILVRLEIVLILMHDKCIVCAEHTIGLEMF
jgi:hypothetical protein